MTLQPGEVRMLVDDLADLRDELRETTIANGRVLLSCLVQLDGVVLTQATGSTMLVLAALREALLDASFLMDQRSQLRVELRHAGSRSELVDRFYKRAPV